MALKVATLFNYSNMSYQLKIYDNFHYMDENEAYMHGAFATYEDALHAAKKIVEDHIISNYKPGMSPSEMSANYKMFGEDPIIISEFRQDDERQFSAWTYAQEFAKRYFEEQTKKST
jgi:hypothetical protein